jgi:molybdopterin-guanine dinucleotide biosynthesis protein A
VARYEPAALATLAPFDPAARVTDLVAALGPAVLDVDDERPFFNVNAPGDVERAAALLSRRSRSSSAPAGRTRAR